MTTRLIIEYQMEIVNLGKLRILYKIENAPKTADEGTFQNGVIVFLDALGTKGIWARAEPKSVIQAWGEVIKAFQSAIEQSPKLLGEAKDDDALVYDMKAFSDTVIIALRCNDDPASLIPLIAETVLKPFTEALMKGIFFRGVIAIGKFHLSDTLIIGPAVDEAADWYEQSDWIGISTTPSATFGLYRLEEQGARISALVRYNVPIKGGGQDDWAVAWPRELQKAALTISGNPLNARGQLLNIFAEKPIAVNAASKYRNTLRFFDFVLKNKPS
jgi:hypothetical protein